MSLESQRLVDLLLAFVEGGDTSRAAAQRAELLAQDLVETDQRLDELVLALASYDGGEQPGEAGLYTRADVSHACRQALHDLGEHSHCSH